MKRGARVTGKVAAKRVAASALPDRRRKLATTPGAVRNRKLRKRRGHSRPDDVAWMISVPVTFSDLEALDQLKLLLNGRDKASVTAAVQKLWAKIEVEKIS